MYFDVVFYGNKVELELNLTQLKTINKVRRSIESWSHFYFTIIISLILCYSFFKKQQEKINLSFRSDLFLE